MNLSLYTDDDDDLSDLDASSLDFLRNLDTQVNGSLKWNDSDLETIPGEPLIIFVNNRNYYSNNNEQVSVYGAVGMQSCCQNSPGSSA